MAKAAKRTLSFFVSNLHPDGSTLFLPACSCTGNTSTDVRNILAPHRSEDAENYRSSLLQTFLAQNVCSRGWSPYRNPDIHSRISFKIWDEFCENKLGANPITIDRGNQLTLERLVYEVQNLVSRKLIEILGSLPGELEKKQADKKPKQPKRKAVRKKLSLAEAQSGSVDADFEDADEEADDEFFPEVDIE